MSRPPCELVLASSSRYRAVQLATLGIPFDIASPEIDEARQPHEAPLALVSRLAREKAEVIASCNTGAIIIGSDQLASLDGDIIGKPGNAAAARAQLAACSGRTLNFLTAVHLLDLRGREPAASADHVVTRVVFRTLDADEIARYVAHDDPVDCAGSFKIEAQGICLFERIESTDPSALVGLPLIATARLLRQAGLSLP